MSASPTTAPISVSVGEGDTLILSRGGSPLTAEEIAEALRRFDPSTAQWRAECLDKFLNILIPAYRERFPQATLVESFRTSFQWFVSDILAGVCSKNFLMALSAELIALEDATVRDNLMLLHEALSIAEMSSSAPAVRVAALLGDCLSFRDKRTKQFWLDYWCRLETRDAVQSAPVEPPLSENDIACLRRWLYVEPYQIPRRTVSHPFTHRDALVGHIEACRINFKNRPETFYSPYCAMVQGSGAGKTRLAMECKEDFFVVYICLRNAESS